MIDVCVDALGRRLAAGDLVALVEASDRAIGMVRNVRSGVVLVSCGSAGRGQQRIPATSLVRLTSRRPLYVTPRDHAGRPVDDGAAVLCPDGRRATVLVAMGMSDPAGVRTQRSTVVLLGFDDGVLGFANSGGLRVVT